MSFSQQNFTNELTRAMQRHDRSELEKLCRIYSDWQVANDSQRYYDKHSDDLDTWMDLGYSDPDRALASVMIAASQYNDAHFLGMVAAGILEDMLREPPTEILDRVVNEARKTPRLRWMLSGVYPHAMANSAWELIGPLIDGMTTDSDPPPAPFT